MQEGLHEGQIALKPVQSLDLHQLLCLDCAVEEWIELWPHLLALLLRGLLDLPVLLNLLTEALELSGELDLVNLALGVKVSVVLIDDGDIGLGHHPAQSCCCCAAQQSTSQCM